MASTRPPTSCFFSFLILFLFSTTNAYGGIGSYNNNGSKGMPSKVDFIRSSCDATLYPALCFSTLSPYANVVNHDPVRLSRAAADVSLSRVRSVLARVSSLNPAASSSGSQAAALKDCMETLSDAADQTRKSSAELKKLQTATGADIAWHVSNAQTWMSAAITNEDTCVDGLSGDRSGRFGASAAGSNWVNDDVCGRVRRAKMYTSIALALVNNLVGGGH